MYIYMPFIGPESVNKSILYFVNMLDKYVNMQDKYVNMQDNWVNMQDENLKKWKSF